MSTWAEAPSEQPPGRVLVIGAGFIGCHLAEACLAAGAPTVVLSRSPLDPHTNGRLAGAEIVIGDAGVRASLRGIIDRVSHVFFCAGGLMPAESNLDPVMDFTLALPPLISVLEELREHPGTSLTFLSSGGTVYGEPTTVPVPESHPTEPHTSYGVMKLAAEKYCLMYSHLYGIRVRILRCSNVYGEYQAPARGQGLVAAVLQRLSREEPIQIFGDGLNVRDFIYVRDIAELILGLAGRNGPPVLNVGSGEGITLLDVVTCAEMVTGLRAILDMQPDRGFDVRQIVLDISALRKLIDYKPTPLAAGMRAAWEAVRAGADVS